MASTVHMLSKLGLIHPPGYLAANIHYETLMGSVAYGVSSDTSDSDVYGFCIPPLDLIFPHLQGEIPGFGRPAKRFEQYQQHHIKHGEKSYDLSIYSIVKYFDLCMDNNPNMIDSLYTPLNCVLHITPIGQLVRDNREVFLSKQVFHKFRGYAFSQVSKLERSGAQGKRKDDISQIGYDRKHAYHVIRLLDECEQILEEGTLDLQRSREVLKSVRRGEWTLDQVKDYFQRKEIHLAELYQRSTLRVKPDEQAIKDLLINCLEEHYGSLSNVIHVPGSERRALEQILQIASQTLHR